MRPFHYTRATGITDAVRMASRLPNGRGESQDASLAFIAGGTTMLDLMKLEVLNPVRLVDIGGMTEIADTVSLRGAIMHLGARTKMADAMEHPQLSRNFPVITQSLALAASPQIRNMASLGGNVLQKTRCAYYRDPTWVACNKRQPGSGCAALEAPHRQHAVLGTSPHCIATYHGDLAQALMALDASVEIVGATGRKLIPFSELHRAPEHTPHKDTNLGRGELITGFLLENKAWYRRSRYVKVRDRQSYEFSLASAAVALDLAAGFVTEARIAVGGVATKPWRALAAETWLRGRTIGEDTATEAARIAFADATGRGDNTFKIRLGEQAVVRALLESAALEL